MKELFPLNTFQQDAVLKRLNDFYELLKDVDVEYEETVATFTFDGNVTIEEDLRVKGGVSITGSIGAASATFPIINGESSPSVKPIYYHGLDLYIPGVNSATAMILNNSPTLISSVAKLCQWAEAITGEVTIALNGACIINGHATDVYMLRKYSDNTYSLYYRILDGTTSAYSSITIANSTAVEDYFTHCDDSVNKIN